MMKKTKAVVLAAALVGSVVLSTEASAATKISTGVSCSSKMKNKTTKVTSKGITDTYKCTTNPISKGSAAKRLVWVTLDCLNTDKEIKETAALITRLKASGTASASEITTAETLNSTAKDLLSVVCGKGW
jgi:curli biogenesis system outer membrane secretion channel CsgG